jgi:predicted choloylglycine hydrolase
MATSAKPLRVGIMQCRGTPYEVGRAQAAAFAASRKGKAFLRRKKFWTPRWLNIRLEERAFRMYAPALWEEIGGIAEGLAIPMERAVTYFGNGGMRTPTGGCSAVMSNGVYGRNYDFRIRQYDATFTLVQAKGSYASIGGSHMLTGRLDGMNERGLSIGLHLIKARPTAPGLLSIVLVRRVLDSCATTQEAVDLLRRLPHAMQYNYSLLDADGTAAVVEAAPGAVAVRVGDWLACTNHFQSAQLQRLNRRPAHSIGRLPPLEGWAAADLTAEQTFTALNHPDSPAFHIYATGTQTLHTIVTEPAKRRILIGVGGDAAALEEDMLDVDFPRWVAGEDLPVAQLASRLQPRPPRATIALRVAAVAARGRMRTFTRRQAERSRP